MRHDPTQAFARAAALRDDGGDAASGVLYAFNVRGSHAAPVGAGQALAPAPGEWAWAHLTLSDIRGQALLKKVADFPPAARDLFSAAETRLHVEQSGRWLFGVLPDFERDFAGRSDREGRLVFALSDNQLITARLHPLLAVDGLRQAVEGGAPPEGPAAAIVRTIEIYLEHAEDRLDDLGRQLGVIEEFVLTDPAEPGSSDLTVIRRGITRQRRELQGLRSILLRAQGRRQSQRAELVAEGLGDVLGWTEDAEREAAGLQERARLLHEEVSVQIGEATNRSMRALTVISTLLIPPTLVASAFGMNLEGIPFAESASGFGWVAAICVALVIAAYQLLRRMRLLP